MIKEVIKRSFKRDKKALVHILQNKVIIFIRKGFQGYKGPFIYSRRDVAITNLNLR
jgi:hypothetical protein